MKTRELQELRQSIWSVRPALVGVYFGCFTLAMIVGTSLIVLHEVASETSDSAYDTWIVIMQGVGLLGLTSAIVVFTLTEILEYPMVMANWFRQQYLEPLKERQRQEGLDAGLKEGRQIGREIGREEGRQEGRQTGREIGREEGREEGRQEGRQEARAELLAEIKAEIREWDLRRREAEVRGEPFDEPPPYAQNGHGN